MADKEKSNNITVTMLPRHIQYLKKLRAQTAQTASDTVRRAIDDYMKEHPLEDDDADSKRN